MSLIRRMLLGSAALLLTLYVGLIAYAYWPAPPGFPAEQLAAPSDRFIEIDGLKLRYRVWGQPDAGNPTIVLIHGFANSVQTFRSLAPALADDYYVIALDMPGFGLSDKPADHDYSNASQAAVVVGMIREMQLDDVIVGGHSMGGRLALDVAQQAPEVSGTVLMNPGIYTTGVPPITQYLFFPFPRLTAKMFADRNFRERFLKNSFVQPEIVTEEVIRTVMLGPRTDDYMEGVTTMMSYYAVGDEDALVASIRSPSLIVWGVEDRGKPDGEAEKLRAALANSRLVMVADAGHYVHEEKPGEVAAAIIAAKAFWGATR